MKFKITFAVALALALTACGSSSHSDPPSSWSLSGNWQMSLQPSDTKASPNPQSGFLLQNNDALAGSVFFKGSPCSGIGSVQGSITGAAVSMVVNPTGVEINLTGTVGTGQTSMSGNYTTLSTGCTGTNIAPAAGTWTASLVAPLNGNFAGTFTSVTNLQYQVSGMFTQGANTGISNAPLTGTLSVTGYCFATANVSGVVSGTSEVVSLVNAAGVQIGQMNLTSSTDSTTLTGSYNLLPQPEPPCGDGTSGTVTLTVVGS